MHGTHTGTNLDGIKTARNPNHVHSEHRPLTVTLVPLARRREQEGVCKRYPYLNQIKRSFPDRVFFVGIRSRHNKYARSNPGFRVPVLVESPIVSIP
jgi:hypothetical protein